MRSSWEAIRTPRSTDCTPHASCDPAGERGEESRPNAPGTLPPVAHETRSRAWHWPTLSRRRVVELAIELAAIYVLWPSLAAVYSSFGALSSLNPGWFLGMVVLEIASLACMWVLIGICLRSTRWLLIASCQLVGNAVGLVMPGGNPTGTATEIYLLVEGGFDGARASTGVIAAGFINLATLFALPLLALPWLLTGPPPGGWLEHAMWLAIGAFVALTGVFLVMLLADKPIESVGRWAQALRNFLARSSPPLTSLPERLSVERTQIRDAMRARWGRAIVVSALNWLLDYLVLMAALVAVGFRPNPALLLLVYSATVWLAIVPLTPGGIGFVEAGLLGMLVLSGVPGSQAALATLAYRLVAYIGPVAVGLPTYWWYRRRLGQAEPQVATR